METIKDLCKRYQVKSLHTFGSVNSEHIKNLRKEIENFKQTNEFDPMAVLDGKKTEDVIETLGGTINERALSILSSIAAQLGIDGERSIVCKIVEIIKSFH